MTAAQLATKAKAKAERIAAARAVVARIEGRSREARPELHATEAHRVAAQ